METNNTTHQQHRPVLLEAVLQVLNPRKGETYLDLTAGYGGHAEAVYESIGTSGSMTLIDRDQQAQTYLKEKFGNMPNIRIIKSDFASAAANLAAKGERYDMVLLDVGLSSPQLETASRGFSFKESGPIDMRMDQTQKLTASQLVNSADVKELSRIIREFGQEPKAHKIAKAIVENRPHKTTADLAKVVAGVLHRRGKIHPATRTFQALRIAVNDELKQLQETLPVLPDLLTDSGRFAVISFHSLEDRLVKSFINEESQGEYEARLKLITKKPIKGKEYDVINPRARSAILRAAAKQKHNGRGDHAN